MSGLRYEMRFVVATSIVVAFVLLGFFVRGSVLGWLKRLTEKSAWRGDDVLVDSLKRPIPIGCLFAGLHFATTLVPLPAALVMTVKNVLPSLLIVSLTLWVASVGTRLLQLGIAAQGAAAAPAAGVLRHALRIVVLGSGLLVLLQSYGVSLAPILTTFGMGGLAVALGLQDTLTNLFAGMQITLAGNIRIGDFIRLESGEEGYVQDVQWRVTRVRTLGNNSVTIPNSRLLGSVVTNYHQPSKELPVLIDVGVHYASDLEVVERVTTEVGRSVMRTNQGGIPEYNPFIRFHTFAESSVNFTVILRAKEFTDTYAIKHEFLKALVKAFAQNNIVIPYPVRALNLEQENLLGLGKP